MSLTVSLGSKANREIEYQSSPLDGSMEGNLKSSFKKALGIPTRFKTFGVDFKPFKNLYDKSDDSIRAKLIEYELLSSGAETLNRIRAFRGDITIPLGALFDNNSVYIELLHNNHLKTSFNLEIGGKPIVFKNISESANETNVYSLIFQARIINSLPKKFLECLIERKKGLVIWTFQDADGEEPISSGNTVTYELIVDDEDGVVRYKEVYRSKNHNVFEAHNLANIVHLK